MINFSNYLSFTPPVGSPVPSSPEAFEREICDNLEKTGQRPAHMYVACAPVVAPPCRATATASVTARGCPPVPAGCRDGRTCTSSSRRSIAGQTLPQICMLRVSPTGASRRCPRRLLRACTSTVAMSATVCTSSIANGGCRWCVPPIVHTHTHTPPHTHTHTHTPTPTRTRARTHGGAHRGTHSDTDAFWFAVACSSAQVEQALETADSWCSGSRNSSSALIAASTGGRTDRSRGLSNHCGNGGEGETKSSSSRLTARRGPSLEEQEQTALDFGEEETWQRLMQALGWGKCFYRIGCPQGGVCGGGIAH